jgi:hypothetical protein
MKNVLTAIMTAWSVFLGCPGSILGDNTIRIAKVYSLTDDRLGETLHRFRTRHPDAKCRRTPQAESENSKSNRENWLLWVDCSVEAGVSIAGFSLLSEIRPEYPFGMTATFQNRRLVTLALVLAAPSVESLLFEIERKCGQPSKTVLDPGGALSFASWTSGSFTLVVEKTPINAVIYTRGFIRITDQAEEDAIAIRISQ